MRFKMAVTKIRDNLYISGCRDATEDDLRKLGVTNILNVADDAKTIETLWGSDIQRDTFSFSDNPTSANDRGQWAADFAKELLEEGKILLIHCKVGNSRSPHIAALALSQIEKVSYDQIYEEIRRLRPSVMKYSMRQAIIDLDSNWIDKLRDING